MNYKVIATDFDGTLLTSDKKITTKTEEALLKCKNNNYIIIGVTARNLSSANSVCNINMFDYLILNNGANIYDVKNKNGININKIDRDITIEITNHFKDIAKQIDYCSLNKYYIYNKENTTESNFLIHIESIDEVKEEIGKMNIFLKDDAELIMQKEYIERTFDDINVILMSDSDNDKGNWITLIPRGVNKFETLQKLCAKLNISTNEVIFFGDSTNDLSIINKVGLGVAMGNALEEVKKQAKLVTLSNDNDGIAYLLSTNGMV